MILPRLGWIFDETLSPVLNPYLNVAGRWKIRLVGVRSSLDLYVAIFVPRLTLPTLSLNLLNFIKMNEQSVCRMIVRFAAKGHMQPMATYGHIR